MIVRKSKRLLESVYKRRGMFLLNLSLMLSRVVEQASNPWATANISEASILLVTLFNLILP